MYAHKNTKKGFAALISVIIISTIILIIAVTLSTSNFYERYDILASEMKERSMANAEACVDEGLLLIANGVNNLATTTKVFNAIDSCSLGPIPSSGNPRIFYTQANTSNYFTLLKISVDPNTISVNSWEEVSTSN